MNNIINVIIFTITLLALIVLIFSLMRVRKSLKEINKEQNKSSNNVVLSESDILRQRKNAGIFLIIFFTIFIAVLITFIRFIYIKL